MDERMLEPIFDLLANARINKDYIRLSDNLAIVIRQYEIKNKFDNVAKLLRKAYNAIEHTVWGEEFDKSSIKQYLSGASYLMGKNSLNEDYTNSIKQLFYVH